MSGLKEELSTIKGKKRRYLLLRIAGIDNHQQALAMTGATKTNYGNWFTDGFKELHKRVDEFRRDHRAEAIRMLRENTQLEAALFEESVMVKLQEELETGEYTLLRTHIGREVYTRLLTDLEANPSEGRSVTWIDKMIQLRQEGNPHGYIEAVGSEEKEHTESNLLSPFDRSDKEDVQTIQNESEDKEKVAKGDEGL